MSDFKLQENRVVLFDNDTQEDSTRPVLTGKVNVGGKDLKLAAWPAKDGTPTLVGAVTTISGTTQSGKPKYVNVGEFTLNTIAPSTIVRTDKNPMPAKEGLLTIKNVLGDRTFAIVLWSKVAASGKTFLSGVLKDPNEAKSSKPKGAARTSTPTSPARAAINEAPTLTTSTPVVDLFS